MKIICVGRNYAEHAKELKSQLSEEPLIFMKSENSLLKDGADFVYPNFSSEIHHEIEIVLKINKSLKNASTETAQNSFDEITVGLDFTARDLQRTFRSRGEPWELAKSFDGSALVGEFISKSEISNLEAVNFSLNKNGEIAQKGNTEDLLFQFDHIISYVSKFISLNKGDLIFTGTPKGVGPVNQGDRLEGFIEKQQLFSLNIK